MGMNQRFCSVLKNSALDGSGADTLTEIHCRLLAQTAVKFKNQDTGLILLFQRFFKTHVHAEKGHSSALGFTLSLLPNCHSKHIPRLKSEN